MYSIVIARYNEDISWINQISQIFDKIYVYNKGNDSKNICLKNIDSDILSKIIYKELPNVGREGHTYLWHILNYRNALEDKVSFVQGNPFDHLLKKTVVTVSYLQNLIQNFNNNSLDFKGYGAKHHIWYVGLGGKRNTILKNMHNNLFTNEFNKDYKFNNGGIFSVTKQSILNRSLQFYQYIMDTPISSHINPHEGFVLERLWVLIFNKNYISAM